MTRIKVSTVYIISPYIATNNSPPRKFTFLDDTEVGQNISHDTELDEVDDGDLLIRDDDLDDEEEIDELDDELAGN